MICDWYASGLVHSSGWALQLQATASCHCCLEPMLVRPTRVSQQGCLTRVPRKGVQQKCPPKSPREFDKSGSRCPMPGSRPTFVTHKRSCYKTAPQQPKNAPLLHKSAPISPQVFPEQCSTRAFSKTPAVLGRASRMSRKRVLQVSPQSVLQKHLRLQLCKDEADSPQMAFEVVTWGEWGRWRGMESWSNGRCSSPDYVDGAVEVLGTVRIHDDSKM